MAELAPLLPPDTTPITGSKALDEPSIARAATIGTAIGFVAATGGVALMGAAAGMDPGSALATGAFVGSWSGAGFGFMIGGAIPLLRHLEARAAHHPAHDGGTPSAR